MKNNEIPPSTVEPSGNPWAGNLDRESENMAAHQDAGRRRESEAFLLGKSRLEELAKTGSEDFKERVMNLGRQEMLRKGFREDELDNPDWQERVRKTGERSLAIKLGEEVMLEQSRARIEVSYAEDKGAGVSGDKSQKPEVRGENHPEDKQRSWLGRILRADLSDPKGWFKGKK